MWGVTAKGVLAHRLRYALTALAVLLGVAFIAGTFVLTETIKPRSTACTTRSTRAPARWSGPGSRLTPASPSPAAGRIDASLARPSVTVPGVGPVASASRATRSSSAKRQADRRWPTARPLGVAWTAVAALNPLRLLPGGHPPRPAPRW